jgi:hypothetical protein
MAETFPALKPSRRRYKLGDYPVKTYRALNGAIVKRTFGNKMFGFELQIDYINIKDDSTKKILDHYTTAQGTLDSFSLPAELFADMASTLSPAINTPSGVKWRYAEAPSVDHVYKGISNVAVSFIGDLDA